MTFDLFRPVALGALFTLSAALHAQTTEEQPMRTLFGSDHDLHSGGWGAPTAAYTRIMDQDAMLVGLRGGWIIDHRFTLGIAGYGLVTPVNNANYDAHLIADGLTPQQKSRFQTGYGGLLLEPIIAYRSPIHISLPILIGAGGCGYQTFTGLPQDFDPYSYHDDFQAFFVLEPGIDLEMNLVKLVKLGLGASYRYTSDVTLPGTPKNAMEGFNASLSIKVGVF
ncbi:MAG: hypothetical protein IPN85_09380 [Flavobacteriales bacterium]|nr:hypothetical protein [Flavobacteriales bacterium]MBK9288809.1 hypothetical protein [Flavobacteriales bacterium]MBL0035655.1 hypothetical protein [Flavobacteriales bacterium]